MAAVVNSEQKLTDKELNCLKKTDKTNAAKDLAEKHGLTNEGLKRVIHSLRTPMTREAGYVSNWKLYEHMQFLEEEIIKSLHPEKS